MVNLQHCKQMNTRSLYLRIPYLRRVPNSIPPTLVQVSVCIRLVYWSLALAACHHWPWGLLVLRVW